jgi:predicted amidohydrolase
MAFMLPDFSHTETRLWSSLVQVGRLLSVALAQYAPLTGPDPVAQLRGQGAQILSESPDLGMIVFPEIHLCGDADTADDANAWLKAAAEPLDGPRVEELARIAAELGVWLVPGSVPELDDDGRVYNTEVVLNPQGELVASYRKVFPWRPYEAWSSGHEFVVFDMPGIGRGGLSICYDAWFPESTRSVAWLGAEFVVNVVKTIGSDRKQERVLACANAIVNQVFMLSVNAAGPVGAGGSIVSDPEGTVIADLPTTEPGLIRLDIDIDQVTKVREVGTEGFNRMWSQMDPDDPIIDLPIYQGRIDPNRWLPKGST